MPQFIAQIRAIYDFWFGTVKLPEEHGIISEEKRDD
jgi:hypothetical protein